MEPSGWLERMRTDHQLVRERLAQLVPDPGESDQRPVRPDLPATRAFVEFLAQQFAHHMSAEDEVLFPIVAEALPATTSSLLPLTVEHEELRSMLAALRALLEAPVAETRDQQIGVQVADLAELLRIHMQKEERLVFPIAERVLRPGELERLATDRSARTREHRQTPSPNPRISS